MITSFSTRHLNAFLTVKQRQLLDAVFFGGVEQAYELVLLELYPQPSLGDIEEIKFDGLRQWADANANRVYNTMFDFAYDFLNENVATTDANGDIDDKCFNLIYNPEFQDSLTALIRAARYWVTTQFILKDDHHVAISSISDVLPNHQQAFPAGIGLFECQPVFGEDFYTI